MAPKTCKRRSTLAPDDYIAKPISAIDMLKVRLKVAENSVIDRARRKEAEASLDKMYEDLKKSHDDLRSVLGQLRVGAMIVDKNGKAIFFKSERRDHAG